LTKSSSDNKVVYNLGNNHGTIAHRHMTFNEFASLFMPPEADLSYACLHRAIVQGELLPNERMVESELDEK